MTCDIKIKDNLYDLDNKYIREITLIVLIIDGIIDNEHVE